MAKKRQSGDWVKVFSALDEVQVQMITARLADAGIPTVVDRESVGTALPLQFGLMARIDIKVQVEKEYDAVEVLIDLGYLEMDDPDEE